LSPSIVALNGFHSLMPHVQVDGDQKCIEKLKQRESRWCRSSPFCATNLAGGAGLALSFVLITVLGSSIVMEPLSLSKTLALGGEFLPRAFFYVFEPGWCALGPGVLYGWFRYFYNGNRFEWSLKKN
jgi:hypothetical protein